MTRRLAGRCIIPGEARGAALVSRRPLSFWGGLNPATGEIVDRHHDRCGEVVTGRVFLLPGGKGSSTASGCLLESVRVGTAPAAIVTRSLAPILALGAIVADELYGRTVPMVLLDEESFGSIEDGETVTVEADGTVTVEPADTTT